MDSERGLGPSESPLGVRLPHIRIPPPGPASRDLAERLSRVESRNVTWRDRGFPVFWTEARGANVRDADGNVYLDLTSAFGVASAGHRHPVIEAAVERQGRTLVHGMGDVHPPDIKVALLERILGLAPWDEARTVLASSGSESVEIALKTAQLRTGRPGVVAFRGGYHGLTLGALSVTAREDFRGPFMERLPEDVTFIPFPDPLREGEGSGTRSLEALDRALSGVERGRTVPGCVIMEPIQGRGGVRVPPPGFVAEVAKRTREAGAVFILDEIFTGLGRTGTTLALQAEEVLPDLLCLGKSLGGGLPLSCCVGSRDVMDAWPPSQGEALHTSTFLGHPLACASALAYLDVMEGEALPARAQSEGRRFLGRLRSALEPFAHVAEVRGRGLLIGVELIRPSGSGNEPWVGGGAQVAQTALREGLIVLPAGDHGEVVELSPPLTIMREQLDWATAGLVRVIGALRHD